MHVCSKQPDGSLGVMGTPLLEFVWISTIHQDSTIVQFCFLKALGEADCVGPKKIKIIKQQGNNFQT